MNPRIPDRCQVDLNTFYYFIGGYSVKGHKKIILIQTHYIFLHHHCERPTEARQSRSVNTRLLRHFTPRKDNLFNVFVLVLIFTNIFIFAGPTLMDLLATAEQTKGKMVSSQKTGRDPFLLPPGVYLLSNKEATTRTKGVPSKSAKNPGDGVPSPLKVKAILISDRIRLALIDRHIVTVGDSIQGEEVLEIKKDRVILGKREQKRTLLLSQSPVLLTVEEIPPSLTLPHKEGGKEGGKGEQR